MILFYIFFQFKILLFSFFYKFSMATLGHHTSVMVYGRYFVHNSAILITISLSIYHCSSKNYAYRPAFPLCSWQYLCCYTTSQQMITCHPCWHIQSLGSTHSLYKGVPHEPPCGCQVYPPPSQLLPLQRPHKLYFFRNKAASGFLPSSDLFVENRTVQTAYLLELKWHQGENIAQCQEHARTVYLQMHRNVTKCIL